MHASPQTLVAQVSDLVSLPDIYLRVKAVIDDPDFAINDLTPVISNDPSLTARLLKLANSAFFGFSTKIDTINRAVNLLGARQIHDLVLATTVADAFAKTSPNAITMDEFWSCSIHCGLLAQSLAKACGLIDAERFFVEGLLYDIGHLIIDQTAPKACAEAHARAIEAGRPIDQIERGIIGCDYAEVGATLMENWCFPATIVAATRWQNAPARCDAYPLDAAVVHIAGMMLRGDRAELPIDAIFASLDPASVDVCGTDADILEEVMTTAGTALKATFELLFPSARLCA